MKGILRFTIYDVLKKLLTRSRSNQFSVEVYMVIIYLFLVLLFSYFRSYTHFNIGSVSRANYSVKKKMILETSISFLKTYS